MNAEFVTPNAGRPGSFAINSWRKGHAPSPPAGPMTTSPNPLTTDINGAQNE